MTEKHIHKAYSAHGYTFRCACGATAPWACGPWTRERLERLKAVLRTVPPSRLRMDTWWDDEDQCGCAIGWACQSSRFPELTLEQDANGSLVPVLTLNGDKLQEVPATMTYFGLPRLQDAYISSYHAYDGDPDSAETVPGDVIEHIDQVLDGAIIGDVASKRFLDWYYWCVIFERGMERM